MGNPEKMSSFNMVLITQEDPFYVKVFFEEFLKNYSSLDEVKGVIISPTMGKKSLTKLVKQMYDFYGPINFVRVGFRYVWYKVLAKVANILPINGYYSIEQLCKHYGVDVKKVNNINAEDFLHELSELDLDLVVSVAAPQVFKQRLIELPRYGCINIHGSTLPKYRGMLPNFWQIYNGEKNAGTTIHRINAGIDDGDILLQKESPIQKGESFDSLATRAKRDGANFMIEAIAGIKSGELKPMPNCQEEATYYTFPTKKDVREFLRKGYKLL